jgi:peptidylprolyl isomerase
MRDMDRPICLFVTAVLVLGPVAWVLGQTTPPNAPTTAPAGERTTTPSGLTIITTAKGGGAKDGDQVFVLYTGRLTNGHVFDSSSLHGNDPIKLTLGAHQVIKGWEEGFQGVQVGQKLTLIIPPDLAYGAAGRGSVIPPNATLEFDIEVVGIMRPQPQQP